MPENINFTANRTLQRTIDINPQFPQLLHLPILWPTPFAILINSLRLSESRIVTPLSYASRATAVYEV